MNLPRQSQTLDTLIPPPPNTPHNPSDNQQARNITIHALCLTLVTLAIAMRIYTRAHVVKAFGWDDDREGIGRHVWDVPVERLERAFEFNSYAIWLYVIVGTTYRLALLTLYARLFTVSTPTRLLIRIGFVVILCFNTSVLFVLIFTCNPPSYVWSNAHTAAGPRGSPNCRDTRPWGYVNGAMNVLEDAYVLLLPLPVVWGMKMRWARKVRLLGVFGLGVLGLVASVVRLVETRILVKSRDMTRVFSELGFWAVIEVNVAIFCACMTMLPAFLQRHWPQVAGLFNSTRLNTITAKSTCQAQGPEQHHRQRHPRIEGFDNSSNEHLTSAQQFTLSNWTNTRDVEMQNIGAGKG